MKYGAVESPINVAFRLEAKTRPGELLVTKAIEERLKGRLETTSSWDDVLKGIGRTGVFSVTGLR